MIFTNKFSFKILMNSVFKYILLYKQENKEIMVQKLISIEKGFHNLYFFYTY